VRLISIVFCLMAVTACADNTPTSPTPLNQEIVMAPGQAVSISGAGLSIRFEGVLSDSRCPANALCVWAGDAHVRIQVRPSIGSTGSTRAYDFHTAENRPVNHDDVTIELTQLFPYPFTTDPIDPSAYRATLKVTR
jgi:hypothetical protein